MRELNRRIRDTRSADSLESEVKRFTNIIGSEGILPCWCLGLEADCEEELVRTFSSHLKALDDNLIEFSRRHGVSITTRKIFMEFIMLLERIVVECARGVRGRGLRESSACRDTCLEDIPEAVRENHPCTIPCVVASLCGELGCDSVIIPEQPWSNHLLNTNHSQIRCGRDNNNTVIANCQPEPPNSPHFYRCWPD